MSLDDVERCIKLLREHDLNELYVKTESLEFRARRGFPPAAVMTTMAGGGHAVHPAPAVANMIPATDSIAPSFLPPGSKVEKSIPAGCVAIRSPIVGTFYCRPSPDKEVFIEVGEEVSTDTVIGLVEALKVYNEIKADVAGTVVEVLVEDRTPVEFDTPLVIVRPHN